MHRRRQERRKVIAGVANGRALPINQGHIDAINKDIARHNVTMKEDVRGNILVNGAELTLIDWQCPAIGDACDDLATFLSPAMQSVNGNAPLSPAQEDAVLSAYGNAAVSRRYRILAPAYHWRMAAYCLWKAERGHVEYAAGARLERARLQPVKSQKG